MYLVSFNVWSGPYGIPKSTRSLFTSKILRAPVRASLVRPWWILPILGVLPGQKPSCKIQGTWFDMLDLPPHPGCWLVTTRISTYSSSSRESQPEPFVCDWYWEMGLFLDSIGKHRFWGYLMKEHLNTISSLAPFYRFISQIWDNRVKGQLGVPPNSVPMVFVVFSRVA